MELLSLLVFVLCAAVVSSKLSNGDVVECIKAEAQLSMGHSSTIQMEPSITHLQAFGEATTKPVVAQLFAHEFGSCPKGEIPVHSYAGKETTYIKKKVGHRPEFDSPETEETEKSGVGTHQHAALYTTGKFHGFSTTINLWQPYVEKASEFSLSQLWMISSRTNHSTPRNTIEAGWQVYPALYGGSESRLFVYWTADGYQTTGCYNLRCPGFVQVNNQFVLGGAVGPSSTIGSTQIERDFLVFQDQETRNWWLRISGVFVGYWPESIVPDFHAGASEVSCGGEIFYAQVNGSRHTRTRMGSGRFPSAGFGYAAYHRKIQVVEDDFKLYNASNLRTWTIAAPGCYNVGSPIYNATDWGTYFFFGGPGYAASCLV